MSRSSGVAILLGLTAAMLVGAWWLLRSDPAAVPTIEAAAGNRIGTDSLSSIEKTAVRTPAAAPATEAPDREPSSGARPAEPEPAPAAKPAERAASVTLNGTAVRVQAGTEFAGDDGSFVVRWHRGADFERREVEVTGGSWSVEVPPDVQLYLSALVLASQPVTLERREFAVPADRFLALRGSQQSGVLLHVLSAQDRRELTGVEVWPGPHRFPTALRHPGAEPEGEAILLDADSPVRIPARGDSWRSAAQYFVRAPGHAWGSVAIDHGAAGERELVLQPSCVLAVELVGNAGWLEPEVRLWPPDASRWDAYAYAVRAPDAEDRAVFEDLAPGTYNASVERGWADRRVSYGSVEVTLEAGERRVLPVTVELPERPVPVTVSGTLTVPPGWEREGMRMDFGGEGDTEKWLEAELGLPLVDMTAEGSDRYAWEVELPLAGSYCMEVFPLLVRRLLEVPPGGLTDVEVVVPPPADVEVTVIEEATDEAIEVESLRWSTPPIEGIVATPLYTAVVDPESGRIAFRAPVGPIRISPIGMALRLVEQEELFELEPGPNRIDLRVYRQIGVRFTFKDGDAALPWDWNWRLSAHRTDGEGRDNARSIGMLWFREAGTYELRSEGIPGFRSIDGTIVEVVDGHGTLEVEIPLQRE